MLRQSLSWNSESKDSTFFGKHFGFAWRWRSIVCSQYSRIQWASFLLPFNPK